MMPLGIGGARQRLVDPPAIDVETGPRQLPSRHLRKLLNFFKALYPPPDGYAVFPEDDEPKNSK